MLKATILVFTAALLSLTGGCTVFELDDYDSFESWYTGVPHQDYDDLGAEEWPQILRMFYGPIVGIPWAARDLTRHAMVIVALPYEGIDKQVKRPAPTEKPMRPGNPKDVERLAAEYGR